MKAYQVKITLNGTKPPIWRRCMIPEGYTFAQFAGILNQIMGWDGGHLWDFELPEYGVRIEAMSDFYDSIGQMEDLEERDASECRIEEYCKEGTGFTYTYDFGDNWEHKVEIEREITEISQIDLKSGKACTLEELENAWTGCYPMLLKWKGNCPPEDCGGIWGYYDYLEAVSDPKHPEHENMMEWAPPEDYDVEAVKKMLVGMRAPKMNGKAKKHQGKPAEFSDWKSRTKDLPEKNSLRDMEWSGNADLEPGTDEGILTEIFECYAKKDIVDIVKLHGIKKYSSYGKEELISYVISQILEKQEMIRFLKGMTDRELEVLKKSSKQQAFYSELDGIRRYSYFLENGYAGFDFTEFRLIKGLLEAYQEAVGEQFERERKRNALIYQYCVAAGSLYGITPVEQLLKLFNKYEKEKLGREEFDQAAETVLSLRSDIRIKDGVVTDSRLLGGGHDKALLKLQEDKPFYMPKKSELQEKFATGEFPEDRYLTAFRQFLGRKTSLDSWELWETAYEIRDMIALGCEIREVGVLLEDYEISFQDEQEQNEFFALLIELWNHTRMTGNRGFTPEEMAEQTTPVNKSVAKKKEGKEKPPVGEPSVKEEPLYIARERSGETKVIDFAKEKAKRTGRKK